MPSVPSVRTELHNEGAVHHIQRNLVEDPLPGLNRGMPQQEVLTVSPYSMQKVHAHLVDQWAIYVARDQTEAWEQPCDVDQTVVGANRAQMNHENLEQNSTWPQQVVG